MAETLRGGVVGAGVFGGHHARKYANLPGVVLAGVYDPHPERAAELAMPLGGRAFPDLESLLAEVDVLTIASPARSHGEQALAALQAGKSIYVEKPLADTLEAADRLVQEAARRELVVACGHQERVLFRALGLFDVPERPLRLEALRHGPPSPRSLDVSVVLDLMIHDLDLALALSPAGPLAVEAEGRDEGTGWDVVRAEATFDDGFTAVFDASRRAEGRKRSMKVVYASGEIEVDFIARTIRNTTPHPLNLDYEDAPAVKDTLAASVEAFLMAVRGEAPRPIVDAVEAARALDLALAVERALEA